MLTPADTFALVRKWFSAHSALLDARDKIDHLVQGTETLSEFLTKFNHLRLKLKWEDYHARSELLKKINRRLQKSATTIFPRDYDNLFNKLHEASHSIKVKDQNDKSNNRPVASSRSTPTSRRSSIRTFRRSAPEATAVAKADSRDKQPQFMRDSHVKPIICNRCKQPGHYQNQYNVCPIAPEKTKLNIITTDDASRTEDDYDQQYPPIDDDQDTESDFEREGND
jgi:hypothetical protein